MSEGMAFAGNSFGYDSKNVIKYRETAMCDKWKKVTEDFLLCSFDVYNNPYGNYRIDGTTKNVISQINTTTPVYAKYWASNKPTYSESYTGSGLPYPNEEVAYQNSENQGLVKVEGDKFSFNLDYPNSYYTNFFKTYVPPQINIQFIDGNNKNISQIYTIKLGNGVPFRSLTWPRKRDWNRGPMFYCNNNLPVRTQAQILRDSSYPCTNQEPTNFWGLNPPN
jgi:hypothetical protein